MKKKVLIVIPTMKGGGAERVVLNLLLRLDREKFVPVLALFRKVGEYLDQLPGDVPVHDLEHFEGKGKPVTLKFHAMAGRLSRLIERENPDVVLSFMWYTNLVSLLARRWSARGIPVVISERYSLVGSREGIAVEWLRRQSIRRYYKFSDRIIANSAEMKHQIAGLVDVPERKIAVIYNPVDIGRINDLAGSREEDAVTDGLPVVVGMGRLVKQKGFEHLIRAVSIVNARSLPCRCRILGEGPEKERLLRLAQISGIENRVEFLGFRKNPYPYIRNAGVFVLSSLYEGFPNAVLEAMSLGVPVVSTRCPTGPEEIIDSGRNGILVHPGDVEGMAEAISGLLKDEARRKAIGTAGFDRVQGFSIDTITRKYEKELTDTILSPLRGNPG